MKESVTEIGSVVLSKMGRDSGRYFIVVDKFQSNNSDFLLIADGEFHKLNNPKKKNVKHISNTQVVNSSIAEKLVLGKKVFDSEVRSALKEFNAPETI